MIDEMLYIVRAVQSSESVNYNYFFVKWSNGVDPDSDVSLDGGDTNI